jgi:hypothetical protein
LANLEGVTTIGAWVGDDLVSAHIWARDDDCVHSHLAASSELGYATGAAYAVNHASIAHFSNARVINLGGNAGRLDDPNDGLARFKAGFADGTAQSYLCGAVLRPRDYEQLVDLFEANGPRDYFPAYRAGAVPLK